MTAPETRTTRSNDRSHAATPNGKPEIEIIHHSQGIDLPLVGHVTYRTLGLAGALTVAGTVGVLEWPVVAAVGATYALVRR